MPVWVFLVVLCIGAPALLVGALMLGGRQRRSGAHSASTGDPVSDGLAWIAGDGGGGGGDGGGGDSGDCGAGGDGGDCGGGD